MNRAVALAGRARHHRDARGQQILAGHLEIGMAAAEQLREQALEAGIHVREGLAEAGPRLAVDLANRAFQRRECGLQVLEL